MTLYRERGAGHNYDAWRPAVPRMLAWMWTQLAPPALRVQFPISGGVTNSTIQAPPGTAPGTAPPGARGGTGRTTTAPARKARRRRGATRGP